MMTALKAEEASQMQLVEREEIDEDNDLFEVIDKLTAQGINAGDVKKLQDAEIHTCNGLMMHIQKNLTGIKGLSEAKVDKICEAAEKIVASLNVSNHLNLTGIKGLLESDKLTAQGINAGDVTKVQDAGLMMHIQKILTGINGLSEAKVDKICEAAEKIVASLNVSNWPSCDIKVTSAIVTMFLLQNVGYLPGSYALLTRCGILRRFANRKHGFIADKRFSPLEPQDPFGYVYDGCITAATQGIFRELEFQTRRSPRVLSACNAFATLTQNFVAKVALHLINEPSTYSTPKTYTGVGGLYAICRVVTPVLFGYVGKRMTVGKSSDKDASVLEVMDKKDMHEANQKLHNQANERLEKIEQELRIASFMRGMPILRGSRRSVDTWNSRMICKEVLKIDYDK